jgi:hypothetical protein
VTASVQSIFEEGNVNETRSSAIRIIYSTEAFLHRNASGGKQSEGQFGSVEEAKKAPFPEGSTFAYIPVDDGYHVYSPKLGWEFHKAAVTNK